MGHASASNELIEIQKLFSAYKIKPKVSATVRGTAVLNAAYERVEEKEEKVVFYGLIWVLDYRGIAKAVAYLAKTLRGA